MSQYLTKSPKAKCFCAPSCDLCPGYRKCIVYSCADSRHRAFVVRLVRGLMGIVNIVAEGPLMNHHERGMRAARRWLKVVTKGASWARYT